MHAEAFHAGRRIIRELICCRPDRSGLPLGEMLINYTERFSEHDVLGFCYDLVTYQTYLTGTPGPPYRPTPRTVAFEIDLEGDPSEVGGHLAAVFGYFAAMGVKEPAYSAFETASGNVAVFERFIETCAEHVHNAHHATHARLGDCNLGAARVSPALN